MKTATKWEHRWIRLATEVASWSPDRSTKVGCVIVSADNNVLATGYNGFPRGVMHSETDVMLMLNGGRPDSLREVETTAGLFAEIEARHARPAKYLWTEHAERNAVFDAARHGKALLGATAYLNWEPMPCAECARALIQAGVKEIVGPNRPFTGAGNGVHYHLSESGTMLAEAGVVVREVVWEN